MAHPHADRPVDCVGFVIVTEITDHYDRTSYQHTQIYPRKADADRAARNSRPLNLWEKSITRRVEPCCTAFPLSAVLTGQAQRWDDWLAGDCDERKAA